MKGASPGWRCQMGPCKVVQVQNTKYYLRSHSDLPMQPQPSGAECQESTPLAPSPQTGWAPLPKSTCGLVYDLHRDRAWKLRHKMFIDKGTRFSSKKICLFK